MTTHETDNIFFPLGSPFRRSPRKMSNSRITPGHPETNKEIDIDQESSDNESNTRNHNNKNDVVQTPCELSNSSDTRKQKYNEIFQKRYPTNKDAPVFVFPGDTTVLCQTFRRDPVLGVKVVGGDFARITDVRDCLRVDPEISQVVVEPREAKSEDYLLHYDTTRSMHPS